MTHPYDDNPKTPEAFVHHYLAQLMHESPNVSKWELVWIVEENSHEAFRVKWWGGNSLQTSAARRIMAESSWWFLALDKDRKVGLVFRKFMGDVEMNLDWPYIYERAQKIDAGEPLGYSLLTDPKYDY